MVIIIESPFPGLSVVRLAAAIKEYLREVVQPKERAKIDSAPDGRPIFVLLKYLKKKEWKLNRTAIETAVARLSRVTESQ